MAQNVEERTGLADFVRQLCDVTETQTVSQEVVSPRVEEIKAPVQKAAPRAASAGDEMTIQLAEGVEMAFVRVPAGEFWMGSYGNDPNAYSSEKPRHKVHLDAYWIGKYPVTNAQYEMFVKSNGYKKPSHWKKGIIPANKEDHPVINMNWKDAQAFCLWASKISGRAIHLPSEAQWEKAARGTDERKYPWGGEKPNPRLLNFNLNVGDTTAVGSYPAGVSPYGALDMAGNVWEWTTDWYGEDYYRKSPLENPTGPVKGEYRVLRGGSWSSIERHVRSPFRNGYDSDDSCFSYGFRGAMTID